MPTHPDITTRLSIAQSEIAAAMARLEADTGQLVESIDLERIEVTGLSDPQPRFAIRPVITLKRLPGHDWQG